MKMALGLKSKNPDILKMRICSTEENSINVSEYNAVFDQEECKCSKEEMEIKKNKRKYKMRRYYLKAVVTVTAIAILLCLAGDGVLDVASAAKPKKNETVRRRSREPWANGTWFSMGLLEFEEWAKTPNLFLNEDSAICSDIRGLTPGQRRVCRQYKDHMPSVSSGVRQSINECQYQFQDRRWNCTTSSDSSVFGPLTLIASREAAFAHAITAAGVSLAVSRACRDGRLASCGCSRASRPRHLHKDWVWGGCGDNLEYGYKFTEGFVDVRERERKVKRGSREQGRALMNRHNNEAGRRAVIKKSRVTCKCHGVSGSCSLITCWQQLAAFREVGDYLRDKYDGATEVRVSRRGKLRLSDPLYSLPTAQDLVYLEESPNYCVKNPNLGSLGTAGRTCNRTSPGVDGCALMCCGRGYNTRKVTLQERCDCKFHWCCYVECRTCVKTVDVHTCK